MNLNKVNVRKFTTNNFYKIFFLLLIASSNSFSQYSQTDYSQNNTSYTLTSPDVNSYERYKIRNVNYYNGKVDVTVPIYTIKTGRIEYPIDLVYNSGGIKVDQLASDVGLGWSLTKSMITRTVNFANDFDNTGCINAQLDYDSYSQEDKNKNSSTTFKKCGYFLQKINENVKIGVQADVDCLPDTYHFFGDKINADFYFENINTPKEINPSGLKIEATASSSRIDTKEGRIISGVWVPNYNFLTKDFFTISITTNNAVKYTFADCDIALSQQIYSTYINASDASFLKSPAQIAAWHITKIEDLLTGKNINFYYDDTSSNPNHLSNTSSFDDINAQRTYSYSKNTDNGNELASVYFYNQTFPLFSARIDVNKKRIKKIIFDEGEINFNYNNANISNTTPFLRNDIYNSDCLTQVYLKNRNQDVIKSFNFNYDYFVSDYNVGEFNPDQINNSKRYNRLKLLSFHEVGNKPFLFTYDESYKLPPINSFSIDFLGYWNKSKDFLGYNNYQYIAENCNFETNNPKLYYYQNQFEKSLLPYNIPNMNPEIISGCFDREANDFSKTWSLTKIKYPTGGTATYEYESNEFLEFGQNIKGGGIRIKRQIISSGLVDKTINYFYNKINNESSGTLYSSPFFGFPTNGIFNYNLSFPPNEVPAILQPFGINNNVKWQIFDKSNLNSDITSGSFVGYSNIIEKENGKGSKKMIFTSNENPDFKNKIYRVSPESLLPQYISKYHDDLLYTGREDQSGGRETHNFYNYRSAIGNSAIHTNIFTDNAYKRGKLLEESIYDESNILIKKKLFNYNDNVISTYAFYQPLPVLSDEFYISPYEPHYYETYLRYNMRAFLICKKDIKIAQYLPTSTIITNYNTVNNEINETINYTFNSNGLATEIEKINIDGSNSKQKLFYADSNTMNLEPNITDLLNANLLAIPFKKEVFKNSLKIAEQKVEYAKNSTTNNILATKYVYTKKGDDNSNVLQKKITYDLYDNQRNSIQYTIENGISVVTIWGYNKTKPIAKIENIQYANISSLVDNLQTLSNGDYDNCKLVTCKEQLLRNALNSLRTTVLSNYPSALVSTFTYDPLVGITSVMDAKGDIQYLSYDNFQRLIKVEDKDGKILTESEYNFKN